MARILITRPQDSAAELANRLTTLGYECIVEPLLKIMATGAVCPPLNQTQAVMITSGNALTLLAQQDFTKFFDYPLFCVGPQTAQKAERLGFRHVYHTIGDGLELASLIETMLPDKTRAILHVSAQDYDSKACDRLKHSGFPILSWPIYQADAATELSALIQHNILQNNIDAVVLFSARSAETLHQLLAKHNLTTLCSTIVAVGLSQAISDVIKDIPWRQQLTTAVPTEDAVIRCLKQQFPVHSMPDPINPVVHGKPFATLGDDSDTLSPPPQKRKWMPYLITFFLALFSGMALAFYIAQHYNIIKTHSSATAPVLAIIPSTQHDIGNPTPTTPATALRDENMLVMGPRTEPEPPTLANDKVANDKDELVRRQALDIARLQSDVVALSASLAAVQSQMKHGQDLEIQIQKMAQATIGTAVDFIRLVNAANSGKPFAREISAFRSHLSDNNPVQQKLSVLEPLAAQAVPSLDMLRDQFVHLEPDLIRAGNYAAAQTWWQRLVARLENLVVVRHARDDGKADDLAKIENELARGDTVTVEQDLQSMPADAQAVLQPWRLKLRMRQQIDTGIAFIADQLTGRVDILSPASPTPVPAKPVTP